MLVTGFLSSFPPCLDDTSAVSATDSPLLLSLLGIQGCALCPSTASACGVHPPISFLICWQLFLVSLFNFLSLQLPLYLWQVLSWILHRICMALSHAYCLSFRHLDRLSFHPCTLSLWNWCLPILGLSFQSVHVAGSLGGISGTKILLCMEICFDYHARNTTPRTSHTHRQKQQANDGMTPSSELQLTGVETQPAQMPKIQVTSTGRRHAILVQQTQKILSNLVTNRKTAN